jgi:hypothetical protein
MADPDRSSAAHANPGNDALPLVSALDRIARSAAVAPRGEFRLLSKTFWAELGQARPQPDLVEHVRQALHERNISLDLTGEDEFGAERRHAWIILRYSLARPTRDVAASAAVPVAPTAPGVTLPKQAAFVPIFPPGGRAALPTGAGPGRVLGWHGLALLVGVPLLLVTLLFGGRILLRSTEDGGVEALAGPSPTAAARLAVGSSTPTQPVATSTPTEEAGATPSELPTQPPTPTATPRLPTVTPTATLAQTALPPTSTPTPEPSATPTPVGGVTFLSVTGGPPGSTARATVQTWPEAACTIAFIRPAGTSSSARGLVPKSANLNGIVEWTWKIWELSETGTGSVVVTCNGVTASTPIEVTP